MSNESLVELDDLLNWTRVVEPHYEARVFDQSNGPIPNHIGWDLDPESLSHVPGHWLQYPEPDKSLHLLLALVYTIFFLISMVGNGVVLWIFSTSKSLKTASNLFVLNLALCDFVMMLKSPVFVYNSFHHGFAMGHLGCQIFAGMGTLTGIGQAVSNCLIAYDRYTTITRPFDGKISRTKAVLMIIILWLYVTPWFVLPLTEAWGRFTPEGFLTTCTFDYLNRNFDNKLFVTSLFIFSYVIPISLTMYFYSQIVGKVFSHEKALREQAKKMNVESLRANQNQNSESAEMRIAKAAITVCFLFLMSWTPYAIMALIGIYGDQALLTPGVTMIPALTCKTVACIDPYVYAISHPKFRLELQSRIPWLGIREKEISDTTSTATENSQATTTT